MGGSAVMSPILSKANLRSWPVFSILAPSSLCSSRGSHPYCSSGSTLVRPCLCHGITDLQLSFVSPSSHWLYLDLQSSAVSQVSTMAPSFFTSPVGCLPGCSMSHHLAPLAPGSSHFHHHLGFSCHRCH